MADDFGRFLQSVAERDIDLLLMEEFHVDREFPSWFASLVGLSAAEFEGAWHSLNDEDGETDLLLRVMTGGERVAILIENKVSAPAQTEQDLRYHIRGQRSQGAGRFDRFVTAICAPEVYLASLPPSTAYEHRVTYEAIRDWYLSKPGARSAWRAAIMTEAIEQGRRGYTMKMHAGKTAFHAAYWLFLQETHPEFLMARPGPKGPKSNWIRFKAEGFPKGVTLNHKIDQSCIDLEFERTSAGELAERRTPDWPPQVRVLSRKKSAALSIPVPMCDAAEPFEGQADAVSKALEAAKLLVPFATIKSGPA